VNRFQQQRQKRKLTQEEVGQKLGVDRSTVAKWESGVATPYGKRLVELAELYKCSIDKLLRQEKGESNVGKTRHDD
jgi:transcriptional regulator with XRE-family HTH domain